MTNVPLLLVFLLSLFVCTASAQVPRRNQTLGQIDLEKELKAGNFSVLDELTGKDSLHALYSLLLLAERRQFGESSLTVQSMLVPRIAVIPGHASYLSSQIERQSLQSGGVSQREKAFTLLTLVGSAEAFSELGRFLFDDRDPERELFEKLPPHDRTFALQPNSLLAASGIGKILGSESPIAKRAGFYGPADITEVRKWWGSPEGEAFRVKLAWRTGSAESLAEAKHIATTPVPSAVSPSTKLLTTPIARSPASPVQRKWPAWPWLIAVAVLVLTVSFVLKGRVKS